MKCKLLPLPSFLTVIAASALLALAWPRTANAYIPTHDIAAGNVIVIQNDTGNANTSVSTSVSNSVNDFRVRSTGNSRGDFTIQIGPDATDDATTGVVMASVTQNGRDNGETGFRLGIQQSVGFMAPGVNGYLLCSQVLTNDGGGNDPEWNVNMAGAYFPFTSWLGGYAFNLAGANGSAANTNDTLIGSPQLTNGFQYKDLSPGAGLLGRSIVNLTNLGYDSRFDGVLLVNGAKNESANYALSRPNATNGTWDVYLRDAGGAAGAGEEDPVAFVFIPRTNTSVISGRFLGNGTIAMYSGASPPFTVVNTGTGKYELKPMGFGATNGVLIISPDGGTTNNYNNVVNYQALPAGDGYEIQTLKSTNGVLRQVAATDGVVSFVYIPVPVPAFTVTPASGLQTTEAGGTAAFTVRLDTQPTDDVIITLASSNSAEGTNDLSSLMFTTNNWNIPQTVTVYGQDDLIQDGNVAYTIVLNAATSTDANYNGRKPSDVSLVNVDNDAPAINVSPTSGLITTEAGGTATFNIRLNTAPSATVTIGLSSSDLSEGMVSPASVSFDNTDWNIDKVVTVTGVDDFVADGSVAYTIITAAATSADSGYSGLNAPDVSVTNTDNDIAKLVVSAAAPLNLNVVEGRTNGYTVKLASEPTANVTVTVTSGNTSQGGTVSPSSLTFTPLNWSNTQPVTVTGANDLVLDGSTSWNLTNSASSSDPVYAAVAKVEVAVTTLDDEFTFTLPSALGLNNYGTNATYYGFGQEGVGVDGMATLTDPNTPNYNGGSLTVTETAGGDSADRLEIRNSGTDPGQIGASAGVATYGGTAIATYSGGTYPTPLVVSFNSSATPVAVEALARNITFRTVTNSPRANLVTVRMGLAHGDGYTVSPTMNVRVGLLRLAAYQQGADHGFGVYSNEADCHLAQATPNTAFPVGNGSFQLRIDWPDNGQNQLQVLMRFTELFGTNSWQIPTNALIVSADLVLYIADTGEGSPLYRMLQPWNEATDTWSTWGNGIDEDDIEARSTFDSQIQEGADGANTGVGWITTSVLADVLAWQSGEANYGWVMPGWNGLTDGTGIVPGDSPTASVLQRPGLRVVWLPAGSCAVSSFRQNVNGYTNTVDTRIRRTTPDLVSATTGTLFIDWAVAGATNNDEQVLLRFDNIVGGADTNQIPPGSQVHAAMLDLASTANAASGDGGNFFAMLTPWQDTDTWNTLVDGITTNGVEAATNSSAYAGNPSLTPNEVGGFHSYEMTKDVQAWVNGTRPNYGWVGLPWANGGDGWALGASENGTVRNRPQLRVFYTPSIYIRSILPAPGSITITFSGIIGNTYSVLRSGTVNGTYTSIGTAVVQPDGTGTFTDNSPLPSAAFYRISYP